MTANMVKPTTDPMNSDTHNGFIWVASCPATATAFWTEALCFSEYPPKRESNLLTLLVEVVQHWSAVQPPAWQVIWRGLG